MTHKARIVFKHKSGNDGGGEIKNQLERKRRRRRRFLLLFLRLSFLLIISLREHNQLIINLSICKLM